MVSVDLISNQSIVHVDIWSSGKITPLQGVDGSSTLSMSIVATNPGFVASKRKSWAGEPVATLSG